jgi:vancomycin resistance protein YoaR
MALVKRRKRSTQPGKRRPSRAAWLPLGPFRPSRRGWLVVALIGLLGVSYAADAVASVGSVRAGVRAGSLELGGLSTDQARDALSEHAELLVSAPVELFAGDLRLTVSPGEISYEPDVEGTLTAAMDVGRSGNVFTRAWHRIRTFFASTNVGWVSNFDRDAADELVGGLASRIDTEGHEAGVEAEPGSVEIVAVGAESGRRLDQDGAVRTIIGAFEAWPRRPMELPVSIEHQRTSINDARRAAEIANQWVRSPVTLAVEDDRRVLSRVELASLIEAVPQRQGGGWTLRPRFAPDRVDDLLAEEMSPHAQEPQDASWITDGARATLRAAVAGRTFDPEGTAQALAPAAADDVNRTAEAVFEDIEPRLSTEEAEALNIIELVSTFTTEYPCCPPRVSNIQRMAETVDGTIVRPGASFSLNGHVGQRTREKGYVEAPMIFDGEYRDDVGGGVSQFATTLFNAVFFGGYKIDTYRAHSYYISRYPPGREATVSWPRPDLAFTNNSRSGILIRASAGSNSVTVSFYGDKEGKMVTAEASERTNFTEPETQRRLIEEMEPGEEVVVQRPAQGFDITVTRIIRQGENEERQTFFTRYRAQPEIIEHGPELEDDEEENGEEPEERGERDPAGDTDEDP